MLFNEVYSCYYNTVSKIIEVSINGKLDNKTMNAIIRDIAFAESGIDIPQALKSRRWPFLNNDLSTVIRHKPDRPLTLLEKRWLKSLLSDPRIKLFEIKQEGLEDVAPLYTEDTFVRFDVYTDGDPYDDPKYIENFRTVLSAMRNKRLLRISYTDNNGRTHNHDCAVDNIEYSLKNDKFRAIGACKHGTIIINLSTIDHCALLDADTTSCGYSMVRKKKELIAQLEDKNNALERAMICFSYLEKETIQTDDTHYIFKLKYFEEDEAEILIQVLSFGTYFKVVAPQEFIEKIKSRILKQKKLRTRF